MSINLTDELLAKTKKGKIASAKQVFLEGDTENLQQIGDKTHQLEDAVKDITVSGGASTATAVSYNNETSGMTAVTAQGAIDELATKNKSHDAEIAKKANLTDVTSQMQTEQARVNDELAKKFNSENITQESGDAEDKVMSQKTVSTKFSDLSGKVEKIETERIYDTEQSVQFFSNNGKEVLHEINEDYANFRNLKSNGKYVLTEHQDVSNFATKSEVKKKQDKINNVESIKDDGDTSNIEIRTDEDDVVSKFSAKTIKESESEVVFQNEEETEDYAKIGHYGIKAKGFYNFNGSSISRNRYIVDKNGGGDYTSLTDCVIEATKFMDSLVYVREGTYDLYDEMIAHYGADFFTAQINSSSIGEGGIGRGLLLKNNIHLIFSAKSKVIFNTNIPSNPLVREQFSPFNAGEYGFTLENANIECNYCRYCVHDERGTSKDSYVNKYINCKMKTGNSGDMFSLKPIGGGLGKAGFISLVNCHFNHGLTWHNCVKDDSESTIVVNNCIFDEGTFGLHHYGESSKITYAYVSNCAIVDDLDSSYETSNHNTPKNTKIIAWNNTKIKEIINNE